MPMTRAAMFQAAFAYTAPGPAPSMRIENPRRGRSSELESKLTGHYAAFYHSYSALSLTLHFFIPHPVDLFKLEFVSLLIDIPAHSAVLMPILCTFQMPVLLQSIHQFSPGPHIPLFWYLDTYFTFS